MMLMGLHGFGDVTTAIDSIPGVSTITDYIEGKAKAGAEQAIPEIQTQVKMVVTPYIATFGILTGLSLLFGIAALVKIRQLNKGA